MAHISGDWKSLKGSLESIGKWQPTDCPVYSIGSVGRKDFELKTKMNISKVRELLWLTDSAADLSVLKGQKLIGSTEFDPERRVRSACGSLIETHGAIEAVI
jgi:hypothetical protein